MVKKETPHFLVFTEHWMTSDQATVIKITGYSLVSAYFRTNHNNGGVAIYSINGKGKVLDLRKFTTEFSLECAGVTLKLFNRKVALIGIYRSNNVNFSNFNVFIKNFSDMLCYLSGSHQVILICGDLNINYLVDSEKKNQLNDILDCYALKSILPLEPTREVFNSAPSAIDYVITNSTFFEAANNDFCIADHLGQIIIAQAPGELKVPKLQDAYIEKRFFTDDNLFNLKIFLARCDFSEVYTSSNVDEAFDIFLSILMYFVNSCCPVTKVKYTHSVSNNWINSDIVKESEELKNLYWITKNLNTKEADELYKNAKRLFSDRIKEAKNNFFKNKIVNSENCTKSVWQVVNINLGRIKQNNSTIELNTGNSITSNQHSVANQFCDYFAKNLEPILGNYGETECTLPMNNLTSMFSYELSVEELFTALKQLKNKKACCSLYDVPIFVLEHVWDLVKTPLCYIYNLSIQAGYFPQKLKLGHVIPLFKKGDPELVENYRSITGLPSLSKILEKVMANRLQSFIDRFKLISTCQHGFQPKQSTNTAAFELVQFIYESLDANKYTLALFFDFTRAFDCVTHEFLVNKLDALGIRGKTNEWIESFLTDRYITVRIGQITSNAQKLTFGVPQGSVLSPLLFILFINDMERHILTQNYCIQLVLYADDTTIGISTSSADELSLIGNNLLNNFQTWCSSNRLLVNPLKTHYLVFHKRRLVPDLSFQLNDQNLSKQENCKFLGLIIDEQLTWSAHIEHVAGKLNSAYFALINLQNILNQKQLLNIYYALAYSHLRYMIIYWGQSTDINRIFILQKRIIRRIFKLNPLESCRPIFKQYKIFTLSCILLYESAIFVRLNLNKFPSVREFHTYVTRNNSNIFIPSFNLSMFKKSPYYYCSNVYNHLPNLIKAIPNINIFKKKLKLFLIENCFYSNQEFFASVTI